MKKTASILLLALLCCLPARAQDLALIFESEPGTQPAPFLAGGNDNDICGAGGSDFDGDGTPDLIMAREDGDGCLLALRVVDMQTQQVLWEVQDVPQMLGNLGKCYCDPGFADPNADGTREAIFVNDEDVVLINPSDNSLAWVYSVQIPEQFPVLLRAVTDLTGDGFEELIISLPELRQVQVWSRAP